MTFGFKWSLLGKLSYSTVIWQNIWTCIDMRTYDVTIYTIITVIIGQSKPHAFPNFQETKNYHLKISCKKI